jgi:cell division protein FtsQ
MMHDLKRNKQKKVKQNRLKKVRQPVNWKKLFHRTLRVTVGLGSGVLIVSGSVLTAQVLLESGYFSVNKVRVENMSRVSEGDILAASDIRVGDGIFNLDLHLIGRKIEENPWIAKAEVERAFPDVVIIRVVEREPQAIADLGYLYYVDAGGEVFKQLDNSDRLDFPVITGINRDDMLNHPDEVHDQLHKALSLLQVLRNRQRFNLDDVSEIHVDPHQGLTLFTLGGGVPILIGRDDYEYKLQRLERVYEDLEPRLSALKYIDLNVVDRVIVKVDVKRTIG